MNDPTSLIERTRSLIAGRRRLGRFTAIAAVALAALLAALLTDAAVALPETLRVVLLPGLTIVAVLALIAVVMARLAPDRESAARLAEAALGDRERRVTAAWQLAGLPGELAAAGALRFTANLDGAALAPRLPRGAARRWLTAGAVVVGLAALVQLIEPALLPAVWPRFSDPRGDHPPYSRTQLEWAVAPARCPSRGSARFEVQVSGRACAPILTASPGSGAEIHVAMFQVGAGRWAGELSGVEQPLKVWAEGGGTRTRWHHLGVDPIPLLQGLDAILRQPAYAHLEPEAKRIKPGQQLSLAALPGAMLLLQPASNRPLAALWLVRDDQPAVRLQLSDGRAEIAALPGLWQLTLEASDGIRGESMPLLQITARTDEPPRATISRPGSDALATPGMKVPLELAADDDLGVSAVLRRNAYNQLPGPEIRIPTSGRSWRKESVLDLPALGVAPGDIITISLIARDTRPDPQFSPVVERHIRVISEAEYNQRLLERLGPNALERKYGEMIRELRELDKAMRELAANRPAADEFDRKMAELAKRARDLAAKSKALHRDNPLYAVEPDLQRAIEEAAEQIAKAAEAGDPNLLPSGEIGEQLRRDLAQMTALGRAIGLLARLRQLADAEQNAVERLEPLAEHRRPTEGDRVRLRELGDDEMSIAEGLEQWQALAHTAAAELRKLAEGPDLLPEQVDAAIEAADALEALAQAVGASDIAGLKRQAAAACRAADGPEALRLAAEARDRLLALLPRASECEGACRRCGFGFSWCNKAGMGGLRSTLGCLGYGAARGYGLGGVGMAGMGFALGYGGDDLGGSLPSQSMDLYGPENFGDTGAEGNDRAGGRIAGLAAGADAPAQAATPYRAATRRTSAAARSALERAQQQVVDDYFRKLEDRK